MKKKKSVAIVGSQQRTKLFEIWGNIVLLGSIKFNARIRDFGGSEHAPRILAGVHVRAVV